MYIYKKVEKDSSINVGTIKQNIEEDRLDKENDSEEENQYQTMTINNFARLKLKLTHWGWNKGQYIVML